MMKALRFHTFGRLAVLSIEEVPTPQPRAGEALVRVMAAAINPSDVKNVSGQFKSPLPRVPGRDYAGVIVAGDAEKGMEVWGSGAGFGVGRDGAHAEYIVVPGEWISPKPPQLSMEQAAAIGVPYLTAWHALVRVGMSASRSRRTSTNRTFVNQHGMVSEIQRPKTGRDVSLIFEKVGAKYPQQREVIFPLGSRFVLVESPRQLSLVRDGQHLKVPYLTFEEI